LTEIERLEARIRELEARLNAYDALFDGIIKQFRLQADTDATLIKRLNLHMTFLKRLSERSGIGLGPSVEEGLKSSDPEVVSAALADYEADVSH
jgi:hypothetical protein